MTETAVDRQKMIQQAVGALQSGNSFQARGLFEKIVKFPDADPTAWLGLAFACAHEGDAEAALAAVDHLLDLEPDNLRGNIFKADHLKHMGNTRGALQYYQAALRLAARITDHPGDVLEGLKRAQEACKQLDSEYQDFLLKRLSDEGFDLGSSSLRFRQSLDILFGKADVYYQQPRRFYFSTLPQIQFYERGDFDWVESVEAATDDIRNELRNVLSDASRFSPYLESDGSHLSPSGTDLVDNDDWGAYYLWHYGDRNAEAEALCPTAFKALEVVPQPDIPGQAPIALFSKLRPRTRIPPHHGMVNTRLICHLPLIVPENCGAIRVGNEAREWVEGELLIFDDSMLHEAWNDSDGERVVLLFDIWRPELTQEERSLVTAMLMAARHYSGEEGGHS
jgi:aspartyl/asparaginyl beta-hydroxylase (cupin superfamily)/Tfp pilus assembly protein PilF